MNEVAIQILAAVLPSVTAIGSTIATVVVVLKKIKDLVSATKEKQVNLEAELKALAKENRELKETIRLRIDKIAKEK